MTATTHQDQDETSRNSLHLLVDAIPPDYLREAAQVLIWLTHEHHQRLVSELIRKTQEAAQGYFDPTDPAT